MLLAQSTQAVAWSHLSYHFIFGIVATVVAIISWLYFHRNVDDWLAQSRVRRVATYFIIFIVGVGAAALADWIDFSEVASGRPTPRDRLLLPFWVVLSWAFLWGSVLLFYHDDRWQSRVSALEQRVCDADAVRAKVERDCMILMKAGNGLDWALKQKIEQLLKAKNLSSIVDPQEHTGRLLEAFWEALGPSKTAGFQLRVALYEEVDGHMAVIHSWNGTMKNCVQSPNTNDKTRFATTSTKGDPDNFVLYCCRSHQPEVVEDTYAKLPDGRNAFRHYDRKQESEIQCIAGMKLGNGDGILRVLVVDCNEKFFLRSADRTLLQHLRDVFGTQIEFERCLGAV